MAAGNRPRARGDGPRRGHLTVIEGGQGAPFDPPTPQTEREALEALVAVTDEWAPQLPGGSQIQETFLRLRNSSTRLLNVNRETFERRMLRPARSERDEGGA